MDVGEATKFKAQQNKKIIIKTILQKLHAA